MTKSFSLYSVDEEEATVKKFYATSTAGTPIIGMRPVAGGMGNEVFFSFGY